MASPPQKVPPVKETLEPSHTFEDAIGLAKTGKFHCLLLLTCGLCFMAVMSQLVCVGLILPFAKCDIKTTLKEEGLLSSAGFFGIVLSSHIMGFLGDTWGRVHTVKWSLVLSMVAAVISVFSVNIWMLIVTRFCTGFFASGCQACVFSLCSEFHSKKTRGLHVTLISVFLPMSLIYSPFEALLILPLHIDMEFLGLVMSPWRWLLLAINLVSILALILLCFMPETPKFDLTHGNHDRALNTMRRMFKMNTGRPIEDYPVRQIKAEMTGVNIVDVHNVKDVVVLMWRQTIALFYRDVVLHTLNICFILFTTYAVAHGFIMWTPTILMDASNRKNDLTCHIISDVIAKKPDVCGGQLEQINMMSWLMAFMGASFAGIYLLFAFTIKYVGKRNILIICLVTCSACCISVHWISNLPLTVMALTLIGSVGNCGGIVGTIAVEFYPTTISAMAMCLTMMVGRLGAGAGSNIFASYLFSDCDILFWVMAGVLLFVAVMCWFLPEKTKKPVPDVVENEVEELRPQ